MSKQKYNTDLTVERARELFDYDPETGVLRWKIRTSDKIRVGDIAGSIDNNGYIVIRVNRKIYKAHRIVWLLANGCWPDSGIDHKNGRRSDNRLLNLRNATQAENTQNSAVRKNNVSGYTGVNRCHGKWMAQIGYERKVRYLGLFETPELAYAAYLKAKSELHAFQPVPRDD